ncbi:hypothetical protein KVV02_006068 [Mortierella alpina]|uniref:Uncharacterized protein n=1 Tax=Mortierella alpina TaxID=64518 RepID=A0A9P8A3A3_MORAP|nr:hypothetical protein KVV02_006068 [Mortierella alpina]
MTYLQHHSHADSSTPDKIRQETTTTTISSTTTTTASSTMPLNSDTEPTMYTKSMHYRSTSNNGAKNTHLELENGHNSSSNGGGRPVNGGRSSSLSSNSSANGQTLNHKSSHHTNLNGAASSNGRAGSATAGAAGAFASHHQNGSNASLPPGGGGGGTTRGSVGSTERQPRSGAHDPAEFSSGAHSWPILFAVLPPLGALVFGKSDIFSDILTLTLIAFFLYNIIKVPWELYYTARTRRVLLSSASINAAPVDPVLEQRRKSAAASLRRQEFFSLLLVLGSPFLGGYTLQYLKTFFSSYEDYLSALNIELFIIASGIRPLTHLIGLLKARALHLQEQVHYPDAEVELLKRKVVSIEQELSQLRRAFATKRDVLQVQDNVEPTLHQLTKQIKRHDKKETLLRSYTEERFASIDEKMREYDTYLAYRITEEQHRSSLFFLPINILVAMVGYCTFFLPARLTGITGSKQQPMLKSPPVPAAIGDGVSSETQHGHQYGHGHHLSSPQLKNGHFTGRQPSHNPITSTREAARLY